MAAIIIYVLLLLILGAFIVILPLSLLRGAPFVSSRKKIVQRMVNLANVKPGQVAADLGCGDGRIVIAFAKAGAKAHGYEINPFLVWWSRYKIYRAGLSCRAYVHWKSFWRENLSSFDIITLYGIGYIIDLLQNNSSYAYNGSITINR